MPSSYEYEDDFTTDDEGNNDDEGDAVESVHYNSRWVLPKRLVLQGVQKSVTLSNPI